MRAAGWCRAVGAESAELQGSSCHREMGGWLPGAPPQATSSHAEGRADCAAAGGLSEERVQIAAEPCVQWGTPCICLRKMGM